MTLRYIAVMVDDTISLHDLATALTTAGYKCKWNAPGVPFGLFVDNKPGAAPAAPLIQEKTVGHKVYLSGEGKTRIDALAACKAYLERFSPEGYGTVLAVNAVEPWTISGQRYASCE